MITDKPMSERECLHLTAQAHELRLHGKGKEADALLRSIPILPEQAAVVKKYFGLKALKELDVNLSNAVAKYGPDFLTK
jgi:hypothetical protein